MQPAVSSLSPAKRLLLALLISATLPYVIGLGDSSIWDANEAYYAQTPREMVESGDYISPTFNYQPRVKKPVLSYWTVAGLYRLFGVSERVERLPIALGGLIMIATAFGLGRLAGSPDTGLVAAIVLATMPRVLMFSRRILIDVQVAMFAGLMLLAFALAETRPAHRRRYLLLMYVAAGLGMLTKGPIAIVMPVLAFGAYLAIERRLGDLRRMMLPAGALIVMALVLPWYVLVYLRDGWAPLLTFFVDQNLGRFAHTIGTVERGPLFYLPVMLGDVFPWSLTLVLGVVVGVWLWRSEPGPKTPAADARRRVVTLLLLWIAAVVGFFSIAAHKQDLYILPIVPAEAALVAVALTSGIAPGAPAWVRRWVRRVLIATGAIVAAAGAAILALFVAPGTYPLAGVSPAAAILLVGGLVTVGVVVRHAPRAAVVALGATVATVSYCFVLVTLPDFERYKPVKPLSGRIAAVATDAAVIGYYKFAMPSMVFYLQRPILELVGPEQLREAFASDTDVYILMTESAYRDVRDSLPVPTYVLASQPLMDVKPRNFLTGDALPRVLLVSNRPATATARSLE